MKRYLEGISAKIAGLAVRAEEELKAINLSGWDRGAEGEGV